jgi:hypothetical protein
MARPRVVADDAYQSLAEEGGGQAVQDEACAKRPGLVNRLYATVRIPLTLAMALVYVVGLALLETQATLAQRVIYACLVAAAHLTVLALTISLIVKLWNEFGTALSQGACASVIFRSVLPMLDAFLALCIGWGLNAFSFYLFNHELFYLTEEHPPSSVRWVAALEFVASMTNDAVTASPSFEAIHWATRLYEFPLAVTHWVFTTMGTAAAVVAVTEVAKLRRQMRKAREREQQQQLSSPSRVEEPVRAAAPASHRVGSRFGEFNL